MSKRLDLYKKKKKKKKKDIDQRTAASKEAVDKRYKKDVKKKVEKWGGRWVKTAKALGLNPKYGRGLKSEYGPVKAGLKTTGAMLAAMPFTLAGAADVGLRAAKKKITGYNKGGSVNSRTIAKKYFKGGIV